MKGRKASLAFIFATIVIDILGVGLITPILPKLLEQFSGGDVAAASSSYGWLLALYALMQFIFAPVLGALSDSYGRRPVILASLLGLGLDYLVLFFAPSFWWLVLGRLIAGIMGASLTAATAYIADVSPPEKRAQNFGLVGAAVGLGFVFGPLLGGILGDIHLRLPFLVAALLAFSNVAYGLLVLPESLPAEKRRRFSWQQADPVGALQVLRRYPSVVGLAGSYTFVQLALNSLISTWVLYTGYRFAWDTVQTGLSLALIGLASAIVQGGLVRLIIPKVGVTPTALLALVISGLSYVLYAFSSEAWMVYLIIPLNALGALAIPSLQGAISSRVSAREQGILQGAIGSLNSLSSVIAPPLATGAFAWFVSATAPFALPGIAFLISAAFNTVALILFLINFSEYKNLYEKNVEI
jgi:MFS transporter, DHA1 family, tetracycline resistance protein